MRWLFLTSLSIAFNVSACPDLSGIYPNCRSVTGANEVSPDMVMTQEIQNNVTIYSMSHSDNTSETYIADGIERLDDIGYGIEISEMSTCRGDTLLAVVKLKSEGSEFAHFQMTTTKSGHTLTSIVEGFSDGKPLNDTIVCE